MSTYLEVLDKVIEDAQSLSVCAFVDICERADLGSLGSAELCNMRYAICAGVEKGEGGHEGGARFS